MILRAPRRREGFAAIVVACGLTGLLLAGALVLDIGYLQVAGAQLQTGLDMAALAGAAHLGDGPEAARDAAITIAARNQAAGRSIALTDENVILGTWDDAAGEFVPLSGLDEQDANAVQIEWQRPDVETFFARAADIDSLPVTRSSIAGAREAAGVYCGILTQTLAYLDKTFTVDSYDSALGPYVAADANENGAVCSNDDISMKDRSTVKGGLRYGPDVGDTVSRTANTVVTGTIEQLDEVIPFPSVSSSYAKTHNNNSRIPKSSKGKTVLDGIKFNITGADNVTLPPGTYYFLDFNVNDGASVTISGPTVIYMTGEFHDNGKGIVNSTQNPANLTIYVDSNKDIEVNGSAAFYGAIIAPYSMSHVNGGADYFGLLYTKNLEANGLSRFHVDEHLVGSILGDPAGAASVALLR